MCFPAIDDQKWLSNLEASQWLDHGKQILSGAVKIVEKVKNIFRDRDLHNEIPRNNV